MATIALAWVLAKPFVTSVIIGAKRSEQLEQNLAAVDVQLTEEEIKQLDEVALCRRSTPAGWFLSRT